MPFDSTKQEPSLTDLLRRWAVTRGHQKACTFVDFPDPRSAGRHRSLTWSQLAARAQAVAASVRQVARPGDRVALLLPQSLDYMTGFLGCLLARVIAVPLFPPDLPGHENRVEAVLEDCEAAAALVTAAGERAVRACAADSAVGRLRLVRIDECGPDLPMSGPESQPGSVESVPVDPDEVAYLQYTSGSTRAPTGAMISHRNVVTNGVQALTAFGVFDRTHTAADLDQVDGASGPVVSVGWLPLFHDMGLLLSVATPLVGGYPSVLMDPIAFLAKPERWLRLLGAYPGALSAAPNFAYDYCASKVGPDIAAELRLGRIRALINGSEPVRADTVRRFSEAFAIGGLRPEVHCPSYGLAEATVFVASDGQAEQPYTVLCRRDALAEGRIEAVDTTATEDAPDDRETAKLVACGSPVGQDLRIVEPGTSRVLREGAIGEILVRGPNVALGYWKRAEQSAEIFGAALPDTGEQPWLRTGDLGALHEGRLLVTGRLKDLLIVDGRNHYPQDIEETVQCALGGGHQGRAAVFAVPGDEGELVVAVAEQRRDLTEDGDRRAVAERAARARVAAAHGLRLDRLVLVPPGSIPRTSSNKVSRSACRAAFLRGDYTARHS
jgi:acyl-CoA synthetase (AMP-forming)/AMP-acid ligase II